MWFAAITAAVAVDGLSIYAVRIPPAGHKLGKLKYLGRQLTLDRKMLC